MQVTIKLFASLQVGRFQEAKREYGESSSVDTVVKQLAIKQEELGMVLVNGKASLLATVLKEGDSVALFPVVGGG